VPLLSLVSRHVLRPERSLKHSHCFVGYTSRYSSKRQPISLLKRNLRTLRSWIAEQLLPGLHRTVEILCRSRRRQRTKTPDNFLCHGMVH
jgi:hypothetical protein